MSKALVIKGANFSANKVTTITIDSDPVPCTGITLSPATITGDTIGSTTNLVPTLTPLDTTDTVSYVSSNANVATVSDSGVVTITGIGTATITATCGLQTATCSVTVTDVVPTINYIVGQCAPYVNQGAVFESSSSSLNRFSGVGTISTGSDTTSEVIDDRSGSPTSGKVINSIPVPPGATKIHIHTVGALSYGTFKVAFYDGSVVGNTRYPAMLKSIGNPTAVKFTSSDVESEILSGATSMTFAINNGGTYTIDQDANAIAEAIQLAISFR